MLAYVPSAGGSRGKPHRLVWVDRKGREEPIDIEPRPYFLLDLSPDGTSLAVDVRDPDNRDVWIYDLRRETFSRLTSDPGVDSSPVWTADGSRVITGSIRQGQTSRNLLWMRADGTGEEENLTVNEQNAFPTDVSPDGKYVVFDYQDDIGALSLEEDREVEMILHTPASERNAVFSPDGRFIAHTSNTSGEDKVYVRPFPNVDDGRFPISQRGGRWPLWAPDGRELFYWMSEGLMAVAVETEPRFQAGIPQLLFEDTGFLQEFGRTYDISPDGQRFLIVKQDESALSELVIVENWFEEIRRLVPTE